jgi:hypothetical protein
MILHISVHFNCFLLLFKSIFAQKSYSKKMNIPNNLWTTWENLPYLQNTTTNAIEVISFQTQENYVLQTLLMDGNEWRSLMYDSDGNMGSLVFFEYTI